MKNLIAAAMAIVTMFLSMISFAHEVDIESIDLEMLVGTYNQNLDKVPGFAKSLFGNERIDLYIDGEKFVGIIGSGGQIIEYKEGGIEKPTMKIYTTSDTIGDLINNETSLIDAVKSKSIQYEGVGFFSKIKFGFVKIFQNFFLK